MPSTESEPETFTGNYLQWETEKQTRRFWLIAQVWVKRRPDRRSHRMTFRSVSALSSSSILPDAVILFEFQKIRRFTLQYNLNFWHIEQPFKVQWPLYVCTTCFNTLKLCILPTQCICVFRMVVTINSDFYPKQHQPVGLCSGDVMCFLWGTNWAYILWHDARKSGSRGQNRSSLLGNDSVNTFPRQRLRKQQSNNFRCYVTALLTFLPKNMLFPAWSMQSGYKEEFISWQEQHKDKESRVSRRQPARIWAW
jgi:hypothetical protein